MKKKKRAEQAPKIGEGGKCRQIAALPWRRDRDGKLRLLLVTSRTNQKWMLPKGWPMPGKTDAQVALIEALEEAGITGTVGDAAIGSYHYRKIFDETRSSPARAVIYPVEVGEEFDDWRERSQRRKKWVRPRKAVSMVFERDLARFLDDVATRRVLLPSA